MKCRNISARVKIAALLCLNAASVAKRSTAILCLLTFAVFDIASAGFICISYYPPQSRPAGKYQDAEFYQRYQGLIESTSRKISCSNSCQTPTSLTEGFFTSESIDVIPAVQPFPLKASVKERKTSTKWAKPGSQLFAEESIVTPKAKTGPTKRSKAKSSSPSHWIVNSDEIAFQNLLISQAEIGATVDSTTTSAAAKTMIDTTNKATTVPSLLRFTVRGNPLPLRRHRTNRGFVYNPSAATQQSFREAVEDIVFSRIYLGSADIAKTNDATEDAQQPITARPPLWGPEQTLAVTIVFRMKRPKSHFIAGKPGPDRLRSTAPKQACSALRTDVDNLAKFVLDSLNGVLYADDRQIVSLHVTKLYDNDIDELCQGSTCVCIRLLQEEDVPRLLSTSLELF